MTAASDDLVNRVVGELLRAPEPLPDLEVARALTRLQAARSDAPHLLLHRVLVLETALQQLRERALPAGGEGSQALMGGADAAGTAASLPPPDRAAPGPASRSFLRDAAVITLGVVAGQAVWEGLSGASDGEDPGLLDDLSSLLD